MSERDGGADGPREGAKEDVLASIRRIVGEEGAAPARRDGVLTLGAEMRVAPGRGAPPPRSDDEEAPLTLDPTMRVEADAAPEVEDAPAKPASLRRDKAGSHAPAEAGPETEDAEQAEPPAPAAPRRTETQAEHPAAPPEADAPSAPVAMRRPPASAETEEAEPAVSRAELRAMVRDAIREELSGELGVRVSSNIKLMVEREVRKALEALEAEVERGDNGRSPDR